LLKQENQKIYDGVGIMFACEETRNAYEFGEGGQKFLENGKPTWKTGKEVR
jgi:hypothetical protein